jgi:hypothetical protein
MHRPYGGRGPVPDPRPTFQWSPSVGVTMPTSPEFACRRNPGFLAQFMFIPLDRPRSRRYSFATGRSGEPNCQIARNFPTDFSQTPPSWLWPLGHRPIRDSGNRAKCRRLSAKQGESGAQHGHEGLSVRWSRRPGISSIAGRLTVLETGRAVFTSGHSWMPNSSVRVGGHRRSPRAAARRIRRSFQCRRVPRI